jgi:hypothetical protein
VAGAGEIGRGESFHRREGVLQLERRKRPYPLLGTLSIMFMTSTSAMDSIPLICRPAPCSLPDPPAEAVLSLSGQIERHLLDGKSDGDEASSRQQPTSSCSSSFFRRVASAPRVTLSLTRRPRYLAKDQNDI